MTPFRRGTYAAILATVAAGLSLAIGEMAFRVLPAKRSGPYRVVLGDSINTTDTTLGWVTRANARFTVRSAEYRIDVTTNAIGGRGPELGAKHECRILVIGDSFVAGFAVRTEDLFWAELARQSGCEVAGVGVEGYATDQELLLLRRLLPSLAPDVVVLAFYQNDIWCNAQTVCELTGKPRFVTEGGLLHLANVPVPPGRHDQAAPVVMLPPPGIPAAVAEPAGPVFRAKQWMNSHSRLYHAAYKAIKREPPLAIASLALSPLPDEFRVLHRPFDPDIVAAWRITESLFEAFTREVHAAGAAPVIFHVPLRESIYRDEWEGVAARQQFDASWQPDAEEEELRRICAEKGFRCVFSADSLRAAAAHRPRLYFYADPHWTSAGHAVAGRALAAGLIGVK